MPIDNIKVQDTAQVILDALFGERKNRMDIEFHSSFRFLVVVDNINHAVFTEFKLPTLTMAPQPVKEGGHNTYTHQLPTRVEMGNSTLRYGITRNLDLMSWYMDVLTGDISSAKRKVEVTMFDMKRNPLITWTLIDAFPVKWEGPTLKSDASSVAFESIDLVQHGVTVQTYS